MQSVKIKDYMNRHPVVFTPEMAVERAVELLLQSQQRGGPVVDDERKVIGFLSEQDCLATMLRDTYHKEQSANVADCMYQGEVLCVHADDDIMNVAQQMGTHKPKIYPVIDGNQRHLVGLIERTDILRALDLHLRESYDGKAAKRSNWR